MKESIFIDTSALHEATCNDQAGAVFFAEINIKPHEFVVVFVEDITLTKE